MATTRSIALAVVFAAAVLAAGGAAVDESVPTQQSLCKLYKTFAPPSANGASQIAVPDDFKVASARVIGLSYGSITHGRTRLDVPLAVGAFAGARSSGEWALTSTGSSASVETWALVLCPAPHVEAQDGANKTAAAAPSFRVRIPPPFRLRLNATAANATEPLAQHGGGKPNATAEADGNATLLYGNLTVEAQSRQPDEDFAPSLNGDDRLPPSPARQCSPFRVPAQFTGLQDFCKFLSQDSPLKWELAFRRAEPASAATGFALKGCVVGCLVGDSLPNAVAAAPWNSGSWSGKCFGSWDASSGLPTGVENVLTVAQARREWSGGLGGVMAYPGQVLLQKSRVDSRGAWVIDYSQSPPFLGRSLNQFIDEMREVSPGMVVGKVFIKPMSMPYNPTPFTVPSVMFALFQTCAPQGSYASAPLERDIP